jgi:hypothetical protein
MSIRKPVMILLNPYQHARWCALAYIKRKSLAGMAKELMERECQAHAEEIEDVLSVTPDPLGLQALKGHRGRPKAQKAQEGGEQ